ncbi:cupredoxin domain-containing protein [Streptomyces sp. H27-C3]|uniref:cupredoxin domain-containing protein n=1 Tax=Streptomyces sp. H27-C3 TaxID=3046305 RepID=UPI0024BBAE02|nr:cupredoxin domain-containing protein [Streptomyces sp. H27-C3]MDJ0464288.1 cupredoxin domain-containing protein [Streptomyces sp. H27-C3]
MSLRPRRPHTAITAAAAVLCMLTTLAGCSDGKSSDPYAPSSASASSSARSPSPSGDKEAKITIKDFTFEPANLTVAPGTKVTVVNEDSAPHTVTAGGDKPFDTGNIAAGKRATFTAPSRAGKYAYICTIHQYMKGSLTVR